MKRRVSFATILLMGMIPSLCLSAAPYSWAQQRYQQARETIRNYYRLAKQNAACVRAGTCPEVAQRLKELAIGAAVAGAVLAGAGAYALQPDQEDILEVSSPEGQRVNIVNIRAVLKKWGISTQEDESIPSIFLKAVSSGAFDTVRRLSGLVNKRVLKAAQEIAQLRSRSPQDIYMDIELVLREKINELSPSVLKRRLKFIYAVTTGLDEEVEQTICRVGADTIDEAKIRLGQKVGEQFNRIRQLLDNPPCR